MSNKKLYTLYKSSSQKKYEVYIENPNTDRINKISFGAKNYSDYTIHKDKDRRERYLSRHQNDNIENPFYSGFWSWHVLWGKSTNINTNMKTAVKLAKKYIKDM